MLLITTKKLYLREVRVLLKFWDENDRTTL